ncbi:MAG: Uma2 family endonuclease [Candidatus Riflebacteria bacterium]|nr:Uma2 family endonuclease [Candidatus Riflebacteria bacterium]
MHIFFGIGIIVAPFDVLFPVRNESPDKVKTVVQPDILVVCDKKKLNKAFCFGFPDLVVEVLSPSAMSYDNIRKRRLYERNGIRELWIIHPEEAILCLYFRDKSGIYQIKEIYGYDDCLESTIFPGLKIELSKVLPQPPVKEICEPPVKYATRLIDTF